jgi:hypothetical protein
LADVGAPRVRGAGVALTRLMESLDTLLSRNVQQSSLANTAYLWSRTRWLGEIEDVLKAAGSWRDMAIRRDRCGVQFVIGDATLGHLRWDGRLDVAFPSALCKRLVAEGMAALDPDDSRAVGIVWIVRTVADVERALWLLRMAFLIEGDDRQTQIVGDGS